MALLKIDWNPGTRAIRQFGLGIVLFAFLVGGVLLWRGKPAGGDVIAAGVVLGLLTAAVPALGRWVYKIWMGFAFLMGTATSTLLLAIFYYGVITPLGLLLRLGGRDALRLKKPAGDTYWTPLEMPKDKSYYERLF